MKTLVCFVCGWLLTGCEPGCDPGQRYELGSCFPEATKMDAGMDDDQDGGADDAAASSDCKPGSYEGFGDPCHSDSDCRHCGAPTCATDPINMCSRIECQNDPEACPSDWRCVDISQFSSDPNVTHICLKM